MGKKIVKITTEITDLYATFFNATALHPIVPILHQRANVARQRAGLPTKEYPKLPKWALRKHK